MIGNPHVLLCYDGSDQAAEAIEFAAALFPRGTLTTVLHVWEPTAIAIGGTWVPLPVPESADDDAAEARRVAEEGAERARSLGLAAEPRIEEMQGSAWRTIIDVADGDADVIVMGTRGLSGAGSLLLGSTSHHVAQHASCPVLIVPGVEVGEGRRALTQANGDGTGSRNGAVSHDGPSRSG